MKIGILGGGQLSQMLALAGIPLGINFCFYFPNKRHSLDYLALNHLGQVHYGEYDDVHKLQQFAEQIDVITYENENIPIWTLDFLSKNKAVYPDKNALKISQDRLFEKHTFCELKIPTNQYFEVNTIEEAEVAAKILGYPFILKKRTQGYDGKGQVKVNNFSDLSKISLEHYTNTIAEEFITFDREVSLIAARNPKNEIVFYDLCENAHINGILFKTVNRVNDPIFELARSYLEKIMLSLNYVGILTAEFFQIGNKLIANEMAPRVHNSGHWTIDACITSQFENHIRAILNLPLGDSRSITNACMCNILSKMPDINELLRFNGLCLHDYQKSPEIGRKLGHITLLNDDNEISQLESMLAK